MGAFSVLCKWFNHSWKESEKHWGRYDCKRCNLSRTYYYDSERGRYYEESIVT